MREYVNKIRLYFPCDRHSLSNVGKTIFEENYCSPYDIEMYLLLNIELKKLSRHRLRHMPRTLMGRVDFMNMSFYWSRKGNGKRIEIREKSRGHSGRMFCIRYMGTIQFSYQHEKFCCMWKRAYDKILMTYSWLSAVMSRIESTDRNEPGWMLLNWMRQFYIAMAFGINIT